MKRLKGSKLNSIFVEAKWNFWLFNCCLLVYNFLTMTLFVFLVVLSVLVFVHEFGHFLMAKKAGILVEEFGFGLPPRIWGKRFGETLYSINALPIGGFVRLHGEEGETKDKTNLRGRAFYEKSLAKRFSVVTAGVIMNLFFAIVCFSFLYYHFGIPTKTGKVKILGIAKDSPAFFAELKEGDVIVAVDGKEAKSSEEFVQMTKERVGKKMELEIKREEGNPCGAVDEKVLGGSTEQGFNCRGENLVVFLIPRESPPENEGPLGVIISDTEMKKYSWWKMPFLGAREGFKESLTWGKMIIEGLKKTLVSLFTTGKIPREIAGPVGIFQVTGEAAKEGFWAVLQFLGILSVNLAIVNVLPLPALDGGRMIFLLIEGIFRKKISSKVEILVNQIGMAFLLALMVLITVNDVLRLMGK